MPTTADYLNNLLAQRDNLADNLVAKGVTASKTELLDTLVPKVLDIESGSGKAELNIFTQMNEPEGKEGIWLKTPENYNRVIVDTSTYLSGTILTSASPEFPTGYDFNITGNGILDYDSATNSIYILKTGSTTVIQRFNIASKTLTDIATLPQSVNYPNRVGGVINEGILYVISDRSLYKINLATGVLTLLNTGGYGLGYINDSKSTHSGTRTAYKLSYYNGYLIYYSGRTIVKYNIASNIYTTTSFSTQAFTTPGGTESGEPIIIGFNENKVYAFYKRDIVIVDREPNNFIFNFEIKSCNIDDGTIISEKMSSFKTYGGGVTYQYWYDRWSSVAEINSIVANGKFYFRIVNWCYMNIDPAIKKVYTSEFYNFNLSSFVSQLDTTTVKDICYVSNYNQIWGFKDNKLQAIYSMSSKQYTNGDLVLIRNSHNSGKYSTMLSNVTTEEIVTNTNVPINLGRLCSSFDDAYLFKNGNLLVSTAYYGDGTQWIKFKN